MPSENIITSHKPPQEGTRLLRGTCIPRVALLNLTFFFTVLHSLQEYGLEVEAWLPLSSTTGSYGHRDTSRHQHHKSDCY